MMSIEQKREPLITMRQQEHEWYGPRVIDDELADLVERMGSRGYRRLCETLGLWNVSITLTSGVPGYQWSWRSRVVRCLHRAIDWLAEHPKVDPLMHADQFDEIDKINHMIRARPSVAAASGWSVADVWSSAHGRPTVQHEPVVAWVIDVLGAVPVTITGVHPDYQYLRRPDGTYTERLFRRFLTEEQVIEGHERQRRWAFEPDGED